MLYFCNKSIKLFTLSYEYVDGMFVEPITEEYFAREIATGEYKNPLTGKKDENFLQKVVVKFQLTARMKTFL
jgi:hypothetical protein